jgi:uncharacterized protein (TIGR02145 family)
MQNITYIRWVFIFILMTSIAVKNYSQVVVGSGTPDGSAVLELQSADKGVLLPRMTTDQRNAISSPPFGLMIFNNSTLCLEMNVGTPSVPDWSRMDCRTGVLSTLECSSAILNSSLVPNRTATGNTLNVSYTGGNQGIYNGQAVSSIGVTGLTATLSPGNFADGSGTLIYTINGTPSSTGVATFALEAGGKSCSFSTPVSCRAKVNATTFKDFICYNLGAANTSADPLNPSWEINGGYWQWGRLAQAAAGPTGPDASQTNEAIVSGWNTTNAPNGSWSDASKTANDPCPAGYRIPTKAQWDGVVANNTLTNVGTWTNSSTNYSSGKQFGTGLFLPAAGTRSYNNGALSSRGSYGGYRSSTQNGTTGFAWHLYFNSSAAGTGSSLLSIGYSIRCIAE